MNEFQLIREITAQFSQHPDVLLGPGDDAAQLLVRHGSVLASTDILEVPGIARIPTLAAAQRRVGPTTMTCQPRAATPTDTDAGSATGLDDG